ncbi:MAG TPA: hypothetical protein VE547_17400 [Mycobacteriales bacterium]|nr:hypothetical protein [Mycobacteriales bacterium]
MDEGAAELSGAASWRLFVLLVRRSHGVTELLEDLLGRPVRSRLVGDGELTRIAPPGLARLATTGPVLRRHLLLTDSRPPHLPVATSWSLVVPWRLPDPVAAALRAGGEPLDRLLTGAGLGWTATPLETETAPVAEASIAFPWAAAGDPVVEQARLVRLDGRPVAVVLDEVPFLPPREPDEPLLPASRRPGS